MKRTFLKPIKIATLILCGVLGLGSLFPMRVNAADKTVMNLKEVSEDLKSKSYNNKTGITLERFVSSWDATNSNWRFGRTKDYNNRSIFPTIDPNGIKRTQPAMALGTNYAPTKEGYYRLYDSVDFGTEVSFITNATDFWKKNNATYRLKEITPGYHSYAYNVPDGTTIPVSKYVRIEPATINLKATHKELYNVLNYSYGSNYGLINPDRWGAWALYNGVEFHAAEQPLGKIVAPNEQRSPCYDFTNNDWYDTDPVWQPYCALCGEPVFSDGTVNFEAPKGAIIQLPVLREGQEILVYCSICGGMECSFTIHHTCKAVSVNRYHVNYNIGTNDPDASGRTANGTWYYNKATEYEGQPVTNQTNYVAKNGFTRPGYEFLGWSTTKGGSIEFIEGDNILLLQNSPKLNLSQNDATITLYAVWGVVEKTLQINANGGRYDNEAIKQVKIAYQMGRLVGKDNQTLDNAKNFTKGIYAIDASKIKPPTGHKVTLNANGGTINGATVIYAPVYCNGISSTSKIINGTLSNIQYDGNKFKSAYYTCGKENIIDTVVLSYKEESIVLPSAQKSGALFIGWYDATNGCYIGTAGTRITLSSDQNLIAKYSTLNVSVTDIYFKKNTIPSSREYLNVLNSPGNADNGETSRTHPAEAVAVQHATGACNISMDIMSLASEGVSYTISYKDTSSYDWKKIDANGSEVEENATICGGSFSTSGKHHTLKIQSDGIYSIDAYGGEGQDYNSTYVGGKGGRTYGYYELKKGDTLKIFVGGKGDVATSGGTGTVLNPENVALNGGGYSLVSLTRDGVETVLMIAGGGSSATTMSSGNAGGAAVCYYPNGAIEGANDTIASGQFPSTQGNFGARGSYGGGGGYLGGKTGDAIYASHTHTEAPTTEGAENGQIANNNGSCGGWKWIPPEVHTGVIKEGMCNHYGHWLNSSTGKCGQGCEMTSTTPCTCLYCNNPSGSAHVEYFYYCEICQTDIGWWGTTGGQHYAPGKWVLNCDVQTSSSISDYYPSYGGCNYLDKNQVVKGLDSGSIPGYPAGNGGCGKVIITPIYLGMNSTKSNYVERIGIFTPDKAAPDKIQNYKTEQNKNTGKTLVTFEAPKSNGTQYVFQVKLYNYNGANRQEIGASDYIYQAVESMIAGYYYTYNSQESFPIKEYIGINNTFTHEYWNIPGYDHNCTWAGTSNCNYNNKVPGIFYLQKYSSEFSSIEVDNNCGYLHIAAVDVAGNIGETRSIKITNTPNYPVVKVIFNTNKLKYQLNYADISYAVQDTTVNGKEAMGKMSVLGENSNGYYYTAYYSLEGSHLKGDNGKFGNIENCVYGATFPSVKAKGSTFIGWNSKPNGTGIWYWNNANKDGTSPNKTKELIAKDIFGEIKEEQTITLYAIWTDTPSVSISATYQTAEINDTTGAVKKSSLKLASSGTLPWTREVLIEINGKDDASGIYALMQKTSKNDFITYYVGGDTAKLPQKNLQNYNILLNSTINKEYTAIGNMDKGDNSLYSSGNYNLGILYEKEGTYTISGTAIAREYCTEITNWKTMDTMVQNMQGYPSKANTTGITVRIDRTAPIISNVYVSQKTLNNYSVSQLKSFEKNGIPADAFNTTFSVTANDVGPNEKRSEIKKVILMLQDAKGGDSPKYYTLPLVNGKYTASYNLYALLPKSTEVYYSIYAVDHAGNTSEEQCSGILHNYSIKTAIYNTANEEFNIDPEAGATYFQLNDIGRVEVWTVGYVEKIGFNFGEVGEEMVKEIKNNGINKIYNMGLEKAGWERIIQNNKATEIPSGYPQNNGIYFAAHYKVPGFDSNGVNVLMPPYYPLTPNGKTNSDGTPQYRWEMHSYYAIGYKNNNKAYAKNSYIFWDNRAKEIHYRVTLQ